MKKVYYAHSKRIFGTEREKLELQQIKWQFIGYKIINPSELPLTGAEADKMKTCFNIIGNMDVIVFSEYKGHVGRGVYDEITIGEEEGCEIQLLRNNKFKKGVKLQIVDRTDWKVNYAKVA